MSTRIPSNQNPGRMLVLVLVAFVVGVVGTAAVMSRRATPGAAESADAGEKHGEEGKAAEEGAKGGVIKLSPEAMQTAGIRVDVARVAPMGESLTAPGIVEVSPNRGAKVTPPAPGKVVKLLAGPGDTVSAGQPLAILQSYDVAQAQAAVRQAETAVTQARAGLHTASAEVGQARSGVPLAEAEVLQARTKLSSAETALARQKELAAVGAFSQAPLQSAQQELAEAQSEQISAQKEDAAEDIVLARTERLFRAELVSKQELEAERLKHEQSQLRVERAKSRLELAQKSFAREKKIADAGLLNAREVQTAEAEVRASQGDVLKAQQTVTRAQQDVRRAIKGEDAARTGLRGAEAALRAAQANLYALAGRDRVGSGGEVTVVAPIGGTVTERPPTMGEAVERTATLFVVENVRSVSVVAQVPEKDVSRVRVGERVEITVTAYPHERFTGVVQSVAGRVDDKTRALPVRCLVENRGGRLRPEMFARVSLFVGARSNAIVLPLSALDEHGMERAVFVQEGEGFVHRTVETGRRTDTTVEILSGVKEGERVAVEGVFVLESESRKSELKEED